MTSLPRRILRATDGSGEAELVTGAAVEFARSTGPELNVVHIKLLPLTPPYHEVLGWREDLEWAEREARELLDEQVKKVKDAGGTVAEIHLRGEQPAEEIVALAEELGISRERVRQLQNEAEQLLKSGTRRVPRRAAGRRALYLRRGISA
jgi:nucleotide-binding universal stress UspA family protein